MKNYDLVKKAILEKKQIHAMYNGYFRKMCPHVIGTKRGKKQALFYQFDGGSSSGLGPSGSPSNWRCVIISKLNNIQIMKGKWHTAPNHSRTQTCVDQVDVEVIY